MDPELGRIVTSRLLLRPRRVDEAAFFRSLWTERDDRVPAHRRIDAVGRPGVDDIAALIRAEVDRPGPRALAVERRDTGEVIGYCGLIEQDDRPGEPELAYELTRTAHGHGFATEAAGAVVEWADEHAVPRLWAAVRDWNVASRRVLAKVGFRETGRVTSDDRHGDSIETVRDRSIQV